MQIFRAELKFWMLGGFASLKSKHDGGIAEANQQNLLNVIANAVKQSLKATQNVIANKVKQSFLPCHCEPKARQSFLLHNNRLPRRYAPRNDDGAACNGLPRRYAPRNDDVVISNGLPRRYAPRNDLGRSMIEMLGVLTIIAVLSVGGIAGYSKAMLMWHSNSQRQALATLISNAISLRPNLLPLLKQNNVDVTEVFYAMGALPEGFTYKNKRLYDLDANVIRINYGAQKINHEDGGSHLQYQYLMTISVKAGTNGLSLSAQDYCRNIFSVAKEIPQEINNVAFSSADSEHWSGSKWQNLWYRADFTKHTMAQVNETCKLAAKEGGSGSFYIFLKAD